MRKIKVALYGDFGHQIWQAFENPRVEITAVADVDVNKIPAQFRDSVRIYASLAELLGTDCELVSLCSLWRAGQGRDALECLAAGKHVYAEKPCAFDEKTLDEIIRLSTEKKLVFHEMAGASFEAPYASLRQCVRSGAIGEVIEVYTQKSYPWMATRPVDEDKDGGLIRQVGVYNIRFIEHVAGVRVTELFARETTLGNQGPESECRRGISFSMKLANGGVASGVANYCGPRSPQWPRWGYEVIRIFGTNGFAESINLGETLRYYTPENGCRDLDPDTDAIDYLDAVFEEIQTGVKRIPVTLEEEIHPTRWVIRAKAKLNENIKE